MNNTDKLLRAFIEASGFDIERVRVGDAHCDCFKGNPLSQDYRTGCMKCQGTGIVHGLYDYKVTKKPNQLDKMYDGVSLGQLVVNIIDMSSYADRYRFIEYNKKAFDAVVDIFGDEAEKQSDTQYLIHNVRVTCNEKIS